MAGYITYIDYLILMFIQENLRFDWLTRPLVFISHLGNSGLFWILLCLVLLIFKRTRRMGLCGLLALLIGALITNVALKNMVARVRPYEQFSDIILLLERQKDFSFPSGHACSSFAAAFALYRASEQRTQLIGKLSVILAAVIAWSRLYVGVHFPTDVLGGALIGAVIAYLVCAVYRRKTGQKGSIWNFER